MDLHRALLKAGDTVEIIAPASRSSEAQLIDLKHLLESWQLNCLIANDIFGDDLFCAHNDDVRFKHLQTALSRPETKVIISARGGYGSMRLIPRLMKMKPPSTPKLFIGMSDNTALHLFLQQKWHWSSLHAGMSPKRFSADSLNAVKDVLFGTKPQITFPPLKPLNDAARALNTINAPIIGGNLSLIQASMGTSWQIEAKQKILFLEDVGERGYRIDRMLEQLEQANMLTETPAVIFGDFIEGDEPDGSSLVMQALERFAKKNSMPVVKIDHIGHGFHNYPLPLNTMAELTFGNEITLATERPDFL